MDIDEQNTCDCGRLWHAKVLPAPNPLRAHVFSHVYKLFCVVPVVADHIFYSAKNVFLSQKSLAFAGVDVIIMTKRKSIL